MRFGLVGLGWAAHAFHLAAFDRVADARLAGGCDSSAQRRREWTEATGTPAFETLEELLAACSPDAVVVATPPESHAALAIAALEAGCHVFCEKPFVSDVAEADRVLAAAAAAGRQVAVNHEFREKPIFRALRDEVGSDRAGRLVFCQIWQLMDLAPWDEKVAWRAEMEDRALFEGGVHLVDLLMTIFGERPHAVFARRSSGLRHDQRADAVHLVLFEFSEGRLGQLTIDRLCPAATRYVEVRADCELESLRASEGGRATLQIGRKRAERTGVRLDLGAGGLAWAERGLDRRTLARSPRTPAVFATAELLRQVVAAFEEDREPPSSAREARDVIAVIEAAYRSSATGLRVELDWGGARASSPAVATGDPGS